MSGTRSQNGFTPLERKPSLSRRQNVPLRNRPALPHAIPESALTGFTLIEVIIVVAISAMLAAIAIGYSGIERDQTALSVEETKISQFILQARSLAIATYYGSAAGSVCGYGVSFDASNKTYSIFAYVPYPAPSTAPCPVVSDVASGSEVQDHEVRYTDETWKIHPQSGITFSVASSNALSVILFYPPNPATLLFDFSGGSITNEASINLETADGKLSRTILVDSAGQVNF
jgi:prepilin-type N-terminal cleavage/methylation domain-containing protein